MDVIIVSSFISSIIQTLISHPFDTLKTWKQNATLVTPNLTIRNLYKGLKYPIVQNSFVKCTSLSTNFYFKKKTGNIYISSFLSGIITTIISCPLDTFKIAEQQHIKKSVTFSAIKGAYKNLPISLSRKVPGNVIFFSVYEKMKKNNLPYFVCGSIAGCMSWSFTYPIDTIKTRMQSGTYSSITDAIKERKLYRGFSICLCRAILVNGFGLMIYEKMSHTLKQTDRFN